LAPEAAVVRIEAACALGDGERARALTEVFERAWPASPLRARVHKMCGAAGPPLDQPSGGLIRERPEPGRGSPR
jgi:hypothetical protein